jgi:hypothetical protein
VERNDLDTEDLRDVSIEEECRLVTSWYLGISHSPSIERPIDCNQKSGVILNRKERIIWIILYNRIDRNTYPRTHNLVPPVNRFNREPRIVKDAGAAKRVREWRIGREVRLNRLSAAMAVFASGDVLRQGLLSLHGGDKSVSLLYFKFS